MSQVPEPWATAMIAAGFTDPRYDDPRPSMGRLAEAAGVHTTTVSRMVQGLKRPDPENVTRVAAALRKDVVEVSGWVRQARTVPAEYRAPAEANLLTKREQDAITELIRAIAATRKAVGDDERGSSSMNEGRATRSSVPPKGWSAVVTESETPEPPPAESTNRGTTDGSRRRGLGGQEPPAGP